VIEKIKPENIVAVLEEEGITISILQGQQILDFLLKLADIAVTQYLANE